MMHARANSNTLSHVSRHVTPRHTNLTQVVLAPDPDLADHLLLHGVMISRSSSEGSRLHRAFLIQVCGGGCFMCDGVMV